MDRDGDESLVRKFVSGTVINIVTRPLHATVIKNVEKRFDKRILKYCGKEEGIRDCIAGKILSPLNTYGWFRKKSIKKVKPLLKCFYIYALCRPPRITYSNRTHAPKFASMYTYIYPDKNIKNVKYEMKIRI